MDISHERCRSGDHPPSASVCRAAASRAGLTARQRQEGRFMSAAKKTPDAVTSRHSDPRTIRERLTLTAPAAKAIAPRTLADKLMLVGILDLQSLDVVETLVESRIRRIRQNKSR